MYSCTYFLFLLAFLFAFKGTVSLFWPQGPEIALTFLRNEFIVKLQNSQMGPSYGRNEKNFRLLFRWPGFFVKMTRFLLKWPGFLLKWPGFLLKWPGFFLKWPGFFLKWPGFFLKYPPGYFAHLKSDHCYFLKWPGFFLKWPGFFFKWPGFFLKWPGFFLKWPSLKKKIRSH